MSTLAPFVSGLIAMGFAVAFWLLALNQALATLLHAPEETQARIYLLRLAAFLIIIVAIVFKNTARGRGR